MNHHRIIQSPRHAIDLLLLKEINKIEATLFIEALLIQDDLLLTSKDWCDLLDAIIIWKFDKYVIQIFNHMLYLNITISGNIMSRLLHFLCDYNKFDECLEILDKAVNHGFHPTILNFTPILKICYHSNRAKKVLQRMEFYNFDINVISYTSAIKSCEITSDWKSALELLDFMQIVGIKPNDITYCSIITFS